MPERTYATPLEKLAQAILEAQVLCNVFSQLGTEADPKLAWRAAEVAVGIRSVLGKYFPNR